MAIVINGTGTVTGVSVGGLPDGVVDLDTLAADSVNAAKIVDGTIVAADIASGAVDSAEIANGAIDAAHMSVNSIDSDSYVDGSIDTAHIADDAVDADKLANSINTDIATGVTGGTVAAAALPKAGGTMTGDITLEAITETKTTKSASFTPDLTNDGTMYSCTGTMTITMPSAEAGKSFTIIHATATSITWAGTIKWNGGSAPTRSSGIDIYVFASDGTNWYGNQAGTEYA